MKSWPLIISLAFILGCQPKPPTEKVVAKVGDYMITQKEFEEAFNTSIYAEKNTAASRQMFLNKMVDQKLIILDAQARNLDKDKEFLHMIQNFWEQSLLTVAVREKSKDLASGTTEISSQAVQELYDQMLKEGRTDKPLNDVYPQIQSILTQQEQDKKFNQWVEGLHRKTTVEIYEKNLQPGL